MARAQLRKGIIDIFVARPIMAIVINVLIAIAGLAALTSVEVREMPDVDPPVISITVNWDGAAPETVDEEVTSVIEASLSQLTGIKNISSSSSYGYSSLTLDLNKDTDIDIAVNEIREILTRSAWDLPDGIDAPEVLKSDTDADPIIRLTLRGKAHLEELTVAAEGLIRDRISAIEGVAEVLIMGELTKEFRIHVNLTSMAARGLELRDLQTILQTLRIDTALGSLDSETQSLLLRSKNPKVTANTIAELRIDEYTRIGDVALVQYTARDETTIARVNGETTVVIGVVRQSQSNTLSISQDVRAVADQLQLELPDDMHLMVVTDDGLFIEQSINEVTRTILMAIVIVIGVIFLFLKSWRAVLIPAITIPVSLIGVIMAIWVMNFSVNTITLLALVLATGMVVDDAIVVVENIVRRRQQGLGSKAAAAAGTNEVLFAVISTTATLAAVFIPISFLPGQAGSIFGEFGFVLAFSVLLSSIVALTLVPVLAARLDPGYSEQISQGKNHQQTPDVLSYVYIKTVNFTLNVPLFTLAITLAFGIFAYGAYGKLTSALTPSEDRGNFFVISDTPSGSSLHFTDQQVKKIENVLEPHMENGTITAVLSLIGGAGPSTAFVVVRMADWSERSQSTQALLATVNQQFRKIPGIDVFAVSPNSLRIRGAGRGLQLALLGNDYEQLVSEGDKLIAAMEEAPEFAYSELNHNPSLPILEVEFDREMATELGLSPENLAITINTLTQGLVATEVLVEGEETDIRLVTGNQTVNDPSDIEDVWVRSNNGGYVPLSSIVTLTPTSTVSNLSREQGSRAIPVRSNLAPGVSLGEAAAKAEALASEVLSDTTRLMFLSEAATLKDSESGTLLVFGIALLVVLLVLAAQFESFASAIVIMLTVPFGLGAAAIAIWVTGGTLNYYSQIGLVILIGIMAKNGILIVEFANQLREKGHDVDTAIHEAVKLRFRPVLMTAISTVCGGLPLVLASGAGAEARAAVGWVIVGGLGFATLFTLLLTPVLYRLVAPLGGQPGRSMQQLILEQNASQK